MEKRGFAFSGAVRLTSAISELPAEDIHWIIHQVRSLVKEHTSVDYVQLFENPDFNRTIYAIDNCSIKNREWLLHQENISQEEFNDEVYWTLLFADEY